MPEMYGLCVCLVHPSGMTAGLMAAAVSNPIDVIKTRLQCDPLVGGMGLSSVSTICLNPKPQTLNRNPKPRTRNPKPETLLLAAWLCHLPVSGAPTRALPPWPALPLSPSLSPPLFLPLSLSFSLSLFLSFSPSLSLPLSLSSSLSLFLFFSLPLSLFLSLSLPLSLSL